jgi:hypothetical protein
MKKDFFKSEYFEHFGLSDWQKQFVAIEANQRLNQLIDSWPVVYADNVHLPWHNVSFQGATRQARLAFIRELPKEPCQHESQIVSFKHGHPEVPLKVKCFSCGAELQATWTEVKK